MYVTVKLAKTFFVGIILCWATTLFSQITFESNLPIFSIQTGNQQILDEPKIDVRLSIHEPSLTTGEHETTYDGFAGIEIRGRSSQSFAKKSYGLETREPTGENLNFPLLGLPAENDWVLNGPYADKSLIRNALTYQVSQSLNQYAPRTRMIELVIDDSYQGVYMLTEKVKRDKHRVDISDANDDLSGGYLFEINFDLDSPSAGWTSNISFRPDRDRYTDYGFVYPKPADISTPQANYIETWMHDLEKVLVSDEFADPETGYPSRIDVASWIDYILINELSRDVDAYTGSTFLVKKGDVQGGKLHAGPVWDHNFSYGNSSYCGGQSVEGFAIEFEDVCQYRIAPIIFANVWNDPLFRRMTAERWFVLRQQELGPALFHTLDSLGEFLRIPAARNFEKWPVLSVPLWPNAYIGQTYQDELQYLGTWITGRLNWLDRKFSEELSNPLPQERSVSISPNPSSQSATPHIDFLDPLTSETKVDIISINGTYTNTFIAARDERFTPIPFRLPAGTYIISFHLENDAARRYLKLVVQ